MVYIIIVESHQHVLEHVHKMLRKKKLFNTKWSMIHFDAHPDMACTKNAPAIACFMPRNYASLGNDVENDDDDDEEDEENAMSLYELLDSTSSGIAEWILPLALAANLNRIEWIKPIFSTQMLEGKYQFAVGVECKNQDDDDDDDVTKITSFLDLSQNDQVKVDLKHSYYMDDASVVSSDKLALKQNIEFHVSELPIKNQKHEQSEPWILDICLDYFVCLNPYIHDLEEINPSATHAFLDLMKGSRFNISSIDNSQPIDLEYQNDIIRFYELLKQLLLDQFEKNNCEKYVLRLIKEINNDAQLLSMIIEAIPNWSMPHDVSSSTTERMNESLLLVEQFLKKRIKENNGQVPFLITIARSSLDGFCPLPIVDKLQDQVLDMIHRIVCETCCKCNDEEKLSLHDGCRLQVIRDYDQWEGSTIP
ncbi:hypothetical protein FRACYDRAFT_227756 [Fragilariopsis cylindrus CCMP1102]|uniref:Uncharacterized protein n=1 Tax=Fragilariopsis cylindrus CCMP1102 TaxID=635003 RepID=A0A1E7F2I6_9STRA|nr:hypothetical protein FRACYDRAFT_227756 [Fragilariopsis cylindrus CCMP1102]|eukprot:OEU12402.1 hypothetical protein FRACYDRAFT_227756 [Fragilariopsis cylindrus CCMP1102]